MNLEEMLYKSVEDKTPTYVKNNKIFDYNNPEEITFVLKREHLEPRSDKNPEGLDLKEWLKNYEKEAKVSTAGIRGPQNILYPHDTRFPINIIGIVLATVAKALVSKEKYPNDELVKVLGSEVRYNSKTYLDLIARIQAASGIRTLVPEARVSIPIWLASFLAFKLDLLGGEYITSSHGISVKNATKDLNNQGSQYLPEESMEFVDKIKKIFKTVQEKGSYEIKFSSSDNPLIDEKAMGKMDNGITLYVDYLKSGVANKENLENIKNSITPIIIENVGGSAYKTLSKVLKKLDIADKYNWLNIEEDPFFHAIGKTGTDPKGNKAFYDWSVDATVTAKRGNESYFPVIETMKYDKKLCDCPLNTVVFITDPDHDRLTVTQVESAGRIDFLNNNGIEYSKLDDGRILTVFSANQAFLMIMDFWAKGLKSKGIFDNHPRFIIKTTASAKSWDEWAKKNNIKVVNVPVGFKEIANIMKKTEAQIEKDKEVEIEDVFGQKINLGKNPRMIFGGEESGGMIIGAEELIESQNGRKAIAMREKSATEAIIVASALVGTLKNKPLSSHLVKIFDENSIISRYDVREDISYYNESEPDIEKLKAEKLKGEEKRTKNDEFFLALAMAKRLENISIEDVKKVLSQTFKELDFSNLTDIKFVGDGTFLEFTDKFVEIRPSGTDAKTKAYSGGSSKEEISHYAKILGNYSGDTNEIYTKTVSKDFLKNSKNFASEVYEKFTLTGADFTPFKIPKYKF